MSGSERKEQRSALDAISSLKRALGIHNHPEKKDEFKQDELLNPICHIYVQDAGSAELIGEILHRVAIMPRLGHFPDSRRPLSPWRDSIVVQPLEKGGFEACIRVWHPTKFAARVQKVIEKHISSDSVRGRQ